MNQSETRMNVNTEPTADVIEVIRERNDYRKTKRRMNGTCRTARRQLTPSAIDDVDTLLAIIDVLKRNREHDDGIAYDRLGNFDPS